MDECFKCGITADKEKLYDAISSGGIVKVCQKCSIDDDIPIIKRPTTFQLKEAERKQTVYSRLSRAAGIQPIEEKPRPLHVQNKETSLRDIIDARVKLQSPSKPVPRPDLVDNFHWVIMRARRGRKITARQLAEAIGESEAAIKMAEKGILPEDDYRLVNKLEVYLNIQLVHSQVKEDVENLSEKKYPARILSFDPEVAKNLTISDLKEMKKQREAEIAERQEAEENIEIEESDDEDISADEMSDLIFRR